VLLSFVLFLALTKYKKRHYHMMKNLLTGVSEVHADLVRVSFVSGLSVYYHFGFKFR